MFLLKINLIVSKKLNRLKFHKLCREMIKPK